MIDGVKAFGRWGVGALVLSSSAFAQDAAGPRRLTIAEAVETALKNNPSIQAAEAEVRAAGAAVSLARSKKGPALSASGFATAGNTAPIYTSPPGTDPMAYMPVQTGPYWAANLTLMLPLYTGGSLEAGIGAASEEQRAMLAELHEMRSETALMAHDAYLMVLRAEAMTKAMEAEVRANEEMVRIARAQLAAEAGIEATVRRAEAELAMANRELTSARNEREKALVDLRTTMGVEPAAEIEPTGALVHEPSPLDLDELLRIAGERRGTLLRAKARLRAAEQEVRAMEGQLKPRVYGMAMADAMDDPMMKGGASVGIVASFPVFDSGMRRSEVQRMRAMRDRARAALKTEELRVAGDIRKAWLDVRTAEANARSAEAGVRSAEAAYNVMRIRVEAGKGIQVELLDALKALTQARSDHAQALYEHEHSIARLRQAAGLTPGVTETEKESTRQ
ncbi:MAG TPA: TolC family protein [Fimbriimonas sp.]